MGCAPRRGDARSPWGDRAADGRAAAARAVAAGHDGAVAAGAAALWRARTHLPEDEARAGAPASVGHDAQPRAVAHPARAHQDDARAREGAAARRRPRRPVWQEGHLGRAGRGGTYRADQAGAGQSLHQCARCARQRPRPHPRARTRAVRPTLSSMHTRPEHRPVSRRTARLPHPTPPTNNAPSPLPPAQSWPTGSATATAAIHGC